MNCHQYLYLSTAITIYIFAGSSLSISTRFKDGDVIFMWNGTSSYFYYVVTRFLRYEVFEVNGTQHNVKNAISYESIMLDVKAKSDNIYNRIIYKGKYSISNAL